MLLHIKILHLWHLETEKGPLRSVAPFTVEICHKKLMCSILTDIFGIVNNVIWRYHTVPAWLSNTCNHSITTFIEKD
jgi:hypothetical protein